MGDPEGGCSRAVRTRPDVVVRSWRSVRPVDPGVVGDATGVAWRRTADPPVAVFEPSADRRAADVLLPVPDPDGRVLRNPAVPFGCAGVVGDRDRAADHAVVDHTAARRRRDTEVLPLGVASAGGPDGAAPDVGRARPLLRRTGGG